MVHRLGQINFTVLFMLVLGLTVGVSEADITNGLVGYYPLNEGAGSTARDISGNGRNGTLHNGVTWISDGTFDGAVNFDGSANTRIELGTWNPAEGTGQLSLAMWIRWAGGGGTYQGLLGKRNDWPGSTMFQFQVRPENEGTFRLETGSYQVVTPGNTLNPLVQTWVHVAATFDGTLCRLYLNGEEIASGPFAFTTAGEGSSMGIGCVTGGGPGHSGNNEVFLGDIDEVRIYNRALSASDVGAAMAGEIGHQPKPADGLEDVSIDTTLAWTPGENTNQYHVYFGTDFDDVDTAELDAPLGVLASEGQDANTFDPGRLAFAQTYYWRVDEVNGTPDRDVHRGDVWSFTTELFSYPVVPTTATASSQLNDTLGPENTINGSGLNANGEHGIRLEDMWLSSPLDPGPRWIQYTFDKVYALHEMWVWNANQTVEPFVGFGAKNITLEYSVDGSTWTVLEGATMLNQGTGSPGYQANTTFAFNSALARYVRMTIHGNYSGALPQVSLSEVQFSYIPLQAREPYPVHYSTVDTTDVTLSWRSGREATHHEVVFGADEGAVFDGSAKVASVEDATYNPGPLDLGTGYFWRIDEVNDAGANPRYEGDIWVFKTSEYRLIDGFELYKDEEFFEIWSFWADGYQDASNGAIVGNGNEAETTVVYEGIKAMPLHFDNSSAAVSEATRSFSPPLDLTVGNPDLLSVHFSGRPPTLLENADGSMTIGAAGADIWAAADEFRYVYKKLDGNGALVARVDSLAHTHDWAKAGVMIREGLSEDSSYAFICFTPGFGVRYQARLENFENSTHDADVLDGVQETLDTPVWVKIERVGNEFNGYYATDEAGLNWVAMSWNPQTINMSSFVNIGLAVTSHQSDVTTVARVSGIKSTGNVSGNWTVVEIGKGEHPSNMADAVYMVLSDSSNQTQTIPHPNTQATLINSYQAWSIPLSDLTVNTQRIQSITLGVGTPGGSASGAKGTVYFDNLRMLKPAAPYYDLFAAYSLDGDVSDSSGNGFDGTLSGSPEFIEGVSGQGLEFDGAGGEYVTIGTMDPSFFSGQLSISLYAKWNGLSGFWQGLIGKRDSWSAQDMMWDIEINVDNGSLYTHRHSGQSVGMDPLVEGEWTHIGATYDGARAVLYRDGEQVNSGAYTFGPKTDAMMVFGAVELNGGNPFNGALDELRIYDRMLSADEMKQLGTVE